MPRPEDTSLLNCAMMFAVSAIVVLFVLLELLVPTLVGMDCEWSARNESEEEKERVSLGNETSAILKWHKELQKLSKQMQNKPIVTQTGKGDKAIQSM